MYTSFFGLNEKPFSITPDPRYLFMSERHGEALAHLVYGVTESGGFIQLTGEVGTGKTTLVRSLLLNRMPENADVAVVLNPKISVHEFLQAICEELHIDITGAKDSIKALNDALNERLLEAYSEDRRTILVVDEAQILAPAVLEQVRLLTNLETSKHKLLQIILIGQPELRDLLARHDLRQLAQRITGRYHLEPLTRDESAQYIEHRLRVAGALGEVIDGAAKREVFRLSQGVPRLINVICDRALLGAYSQEIRVINKQIIKRAAAEVSGKLEVSTTPRNAALAAAIVGISIVVGSLWFVNREAPLITPKEVPIAAEIIVAGPAMVAIVEPLESSLAEQLSEAGELTSADFAFASLLDMWNLEYTTGGDSGCAQAENKGLACLTQRGSWNNLKQLNRPAILSVIDTQGTTHNVVLTAIHGDSAELSIGGVPVTHLVSTILEFWYGEYTLLWQPPNGSTVSLLPGSRGPEVIWLRQSLDNIDERYTTIANDFYDNKLATVVRQFQRDYRLHVDGLAGQQTQIIVTTLLGPNGSPRLTRD